MKKIHVTPRPDFHLHTSPTYLAQQAMFCQILFLFFFARADFFFLACVDFVRTVREMAENINKILGPLWSAVAKVNQLPLIDYTILLLYGNVQRKIILLCQTPLVI